MRMQTISPIRRTADRLAERIGHYVEHVCSLIVFDASPKLKAVARVVTAFFGHFNFQNDNGRQASNRKPFIVRAHTNSFSFCYEPPLPDERVTRGKHRRINLATEKDFERRIDC